MEKSLKEAEGIKLDICCGYRKAFGFIGIDSRPLPGVDLVCDIETGLPYPDSSVDAIRMHDALEHIRPDSIIAVINDVWRVLKPGGLFDTFTPSTDGRGAFQDPTHISFWNENSWFYYTLKPYRDLYGIKAHFEIIELYTTPLDSHKICHVVAKLRCVKELL